MWIFVMFWIIFVPAILLFWRLRFIWRPARANIGQAPAPTASSENQGSPTETSSPPQNQQPNITHEIEEVVETEEESPSVDSSRSTASTTVSTESIGCRKRSCYAWGNKSCAFLAGIGGLVVGYLTMVTGGILALPQYMVMVSGDIYNQQVKSYGDDFCYYRNQWILLHSSAIYIMAIIGILISSVSIRWGRRRVLRVGTILSMSGVCCMAWFPNVYVEVTGLLLIGAGVGSIYHVIPIIYKELVPKENRIEVFDWGISIGNIFALGFNYLTAHFHVWGWRVLFGVMGIPIGFLLFISFIALESSQSYTEQNIIDKSALRELLRPHNCPALVIKTVETVFESCTSSDLLIYYGPFILQSIGYDDDVAFLAPMVLAAIQAIAKVVGGLLIQQVGRRRTYFVGYFASVMPMVFLGLIFHLHPNKHHHLKPHQATVSVVLVAMHAAGNGLIMGPPGWLASPFPEECSAIASTYALCLKLFISFVVNNMFLHVLCLLREWTFFFFAGCTAGIMVFTFFLVPETKDTPQLERARRIWRQHWFWRRLFT